MTPSVHGCPIAMSYVTLSAWRDRELPSEQAQQTRDHIQGCAACQQYLADLDQINQAIRRHSPPENAQDAIWRGARTTITAKRGNMTKSQRTFAIAGFGAVVIFITLFAVVFTRFMSKPATVHITPTQTPAVNASTLLSVQQTSGDSSSEITSLVGYSPTTGHVLFTHTLPAGVTQYSAATQHLLGVIVSTNSSGQQLTTALQLYNASGSLARQVSLGALGPSFALANNDTFFVGGQDASNITKGGGAPPMLITAITAATGAQRWQQSFGNSATGFAYFTVAGAELVGVIEYATGNQQLIALNAATGTIDWQTPLNVSGPIIFGGNTVYALALIPPANQTEKASQKVFAFAAATGVTVWTKDVTGDPSGATQAQCVAADQNGVYCAIVQASPTATNSALIAFAAPDGKQLWRSPSIQYLANLNGQTAPIVNGTLYLPIQQTANGGSGITIQLAGIRITDGTKVWSATLDSAPETAPYDSGGTIYLGLQTRAGSNASIIAISASGSLVWETPTPAAYILELAMMS